MFDPQAKQHSVIKRIAIGVLIVAALGAVAYGVAMLLKNISNSAAPTGSLQNSSSNQATASGAPSANAIIGSYTQSGAIQALSGYQMQQDVSAPARITLKADDQTYAVSVSTPNYALFYAKGTPSASDAKSIASQTTDFLKQKGFATANSVDTSTAQLAYATYTNLGSVCQLTSAAASTPAYYMIACADKSNIEKEYSDIKKLLDLFQKSNQLAPFTRATTSTVSTDNKTMTTISLTTDKQQHPVLLFAAINSNWEYLGNIGDGSGVASNGKYSLNPAVINAIHQAKYGDFLTHNLQQ